MSDRPTLGVVVTAAGYGTRLGLDGPKQYVDIGGRSMLERTVDRLAACPAVDAVVVVVNEEDVTFCRDEVVGGRFGNVLGVVAGGAERSLSVENGLRALVAAGRFDLLGVHDGARPFVDCADIVRAVACLAEDGGLSGVVVGLPSTDTVKLVGGDGVVRDTPPRRRVWRAQTPQVFRAESLLAAYRAGPGELSAATDDSSLVEAAGGRVAVIEGNPENLKVTTPLDLQLAGLIAGQDVAAHASAGGESPVPFRVGLGVDAHGFAPDRALVLGGVRVRDRDGLAGHSDADVVAHAAMDAILGAAGLEDIGHYFPDDDPDLEGADSLLLLRRVAGLAASAGWRVGNVDVVVVCEEPKIAPHRPEMRENLAGAMGVAPASINVRGTTTEGLGFTGRREGIMANAVAMLFAAARRGGGEVPV